MVCAAGGITADSDTRLLFSGSNNLSIQNVTGRTVNRLSARSIEAGGLAG